MWPVIADSFDFIFESCSDGTEEVLASEIVLEFELVIELELDVLVPEFIPPSIAYGSHDLQFKLLKKSPIVASVVYPVYWLEFA